jgi:hypothetical protein
MNRRTLAALTAAVLLAGCDASSRGRDAYREGRFRDAHQAFAAAADAAGDGASAELLYDRALSALRDGDPRDAEASARKAAERDGAEIAALADFVRGSAAFARCETAALQAGAPEAEPFAYDVAIAAAASARDAWETAAANRADWPEARRNVERALLRIAQLRDKKAEAERRRNQKSAPRPNPKPVPQAKPSPDPRDPARPPVPPKPPSDGSAPGEDAKTEAQLAELTPSQVRQLFERLAAKEKEKLDLRRSRRQATSADVERDW